MSPDYKSPHEVIMNDITVERLRQVQKWGVQHRPNFDGMYQPDALVRLMNAQREYCDAREKAGPQPGYTGGAPWQAIINEELAEAVAELTDKAALRKELVQCTAVLVAWIEDLDTHQ